LITRVDRLAAGLVARGLGTPPAADRPDHETGQDHAGLLLHNGAEFVEAVLGSCAARLAPATLNYTYAVPELRALLQDLRPGALLFHRCFGER
jgi:fatty-acyl-CoA synthase